MDRIGIREESSILVNGIYRSSGSESQPYGEEEFNEIRQRGYDATIVHLWEGSACREP